LPISLSMLAASSAETKCRRAISHPPFRRATDRLPWGGCVHDQPVSLCDRRRARLVDLTPPSP
jgi:hypothetical protein